MPDDKGHKFGYREEVLEVLQSLLAPYEDITTDNMFGFPAFRASGQIFACVYEQGISLKMPKDAAEAIVQNSGISPFVPFGRARMRQWIHIQRKKPSAFMKDFPLIEASIHYVRTLKSRGKTAEKPSKTKPTSSSATSSKPSKAAAKSPAKKAASATRTPPAKKASTKKKSAAGKKPSSAKKPAKKAAKSSPARATAKKKTKAAPKSGSATSAKKSAKKTGAKKKAATRSSPAKKAKKKSPKKAAKRPAKKAKRRR